MTKGSHDEKDLGKVYDAQLVKRLLHYANPYKLIIILSITLLVLITAIELAQPYLIKVAIDEHINGLYEPMTAFDQGAESADGVFFKNKVYVRLNDLPDRHAGMMSTYQIHEENGEFYLENKTDKTEIALSKEEVQLFRQQDIDALYQIGGFFFLLLIFGFILNYIQFYLLQYTGQHIIFKIRQDVFSHVQTLSLSFFDKSPVGRLVTRVTNDTEALNDMYTNVMVNLFKDVFILLGIIVIMLNLNVTLAIISFVSIPIIVLTSYLYKKIARGAFRKVRLKLAQINATLNENITGMRIVHIFNREKQQFQQFDETNSDYFQSSISELKTSALFRPSMDFIYSISLAFLIWFGGHDVINGVIEFGVLYAFIEYIRRFFQPINDITEKYTIMQSAMASSERIFQLLDENDRIENPSNPVSISEIQEIEFDHVWFAYQEEDWVLKDVSFTIKAGEMVALVGATGAGKSSIINLLTRFYDVQKGAIRINGVDIRSLDKFELREHIGVVLQDVFLFAEDIQSNIRLNNLDISDEEVKQVAHYVNADQFIKRLPNQYNEEVKERGATLSQGQKQLLAFARTLAFQPSILILDEATANIDTETEKLIQDALQKIIEGRTTIAIAHRLSTIQHADNIMVLHKGEIREMGTHQELLSLGGLYYKLYQLQYKEEFVEMES